ncbi:MAG: family 16 glycosylhydrolase [Clostridia bacterium]|nr:family 16 glycosylhydrolase [Clostridia bacterium]
MRKIAAFSVIIALACSVFAGTAFFASAVTAQEAMAAAKPELYGLYTAQSAGLLRDAYDRTSAALEAGRSGAEEASALSAALDALVPVEDYRRGTLLGFDGVTDEDLAAMRLNRGSVSVSDGAVSITGEGTLRYCNAVRGGIAGGSPFGIATPEYDGFAIKINSASDAALDLEIGRRGSPDDCVFTISDIYVSAGERYYLFPFSRFGDLPLDGTLNYISLTFSGTQEVSFSDLHAAASSDDAVRRSTTETPLTSQNFSPTAFYKILQRDTDLALTMNDTSGGQDRFTFTENAENDDSQLWQICRDPVMTSRFRITNKKFGTSIAKAPSGDMTLSAKVADYTDDLQKWSCSYSRTKGFHFYLSGVGKLSYSGTHARFAGPGTATRYFDVLCAGDEEWTQVWSDEFDTLDRSVWYVVNSKNRGDTEPMFNRDSPNNVYTENGNLVIKTIKEDYRGYHATSAYLTTEDKIHFSYGRFEMRARLPEGRKIWPAFWLMGDDNVWPYCAEIDVVEAVGSGPDDDWLGDRRSIATFHYCNAGNHYEIGGWSDFNILTHTEKLSENYHIYAVEWEYDQIRWYFDDTLYLTVNVEGDALKNALQENPMFMILDTSIEGPGNNRLPDGMPDEAYFYIDYIRYCKPSTSAAPADSLPYEYVSSSPDFHQIIWSPANVGAVNIEKNMFVYNDAACNTSVFNLTEMKRVAFRNLTQSGWTMASAVSADGSTLAFGRQSRFTVCDSNLNVPYNEDAPLEFPALALSNDGSRLYYGGVPRSNGEEFAERFHIYDTVNMQWLSSEYTGSWVDSIAVRDDDVYAYGCFNGLVRVRSASGGDLGEFNAGGRALSLAFSPDRRKLYAACGDQKIYVYDIETRSARVFASCGDEIYRVAVSPDGTRVTAACGDACARVYDTATGRLVARPCLGDLAVTYVDYSLDGKLLALCGLDAKVGVYRADDGLPLALLSNTDSTCWYNTVAISADNTSVMAIRGVENFNSAVSGWKLPADLLPADGGDSSALDALPCYDETAYTPESYAPYAAALKNAHAVRANRYSSQSDIDSAAAAVSAAAEGLVELDYMKGDFDFDGEITVSDALAALRIAAKLADETPESVLIGDIDGDGHVTVSDALAILRVAAKLADAL